MTDVMAQIREVGIIPVVRAQSADEAFAVVEAIRAGGIPVLEITMTVPGAVGVIRDLARAGKGVLLISSDLPELLTVSDRILVLRQGTIVSEFDAQGATQEQILLAASGLDASPKGLA